ncbi:MAG: YqcC family protein [Pseudomonadales bacterium]
MVNQHFPPEPYSQLADIILELEAALRACALWEPAPPPPEALMSCEPFCIDTLRFSQWLQFVFITRIKLIIETQAPLPEQSGIVPIAEESFRQVSFNPNRIISVLARFDMLIETGKY